MTQHLLLLGDCRFVDSEISPGSVDLIVTSPPYFNAPFDYEDLFRTYGSFLDLLQKFSELSFRVLRPGGIAAVNIDDMLVNKIKYPIISDTTKIFVTTGFLCHGRIIWKKPEGYIRISQRSGVFLQNPYPMYFYPDNLLESIIIFQKGKFDYKSISKEVREKSKVDTKEFNNKKWYSVLWEMTNVLPGATLEKDIAAFPEELPYRLIKLFSYKGETVLDPFAGSGTTMKVARMLERNSIGMEIKKSLVPIIKKKLGFDGGQNTFFTDQNDKLEIINRKAGKYGPIS